MYISKIVFIWMFIQSDNRSESTIFHSCIDKDFAGVGKPWESRFGSDIHQSENRIYILAGDSHKIKCCGHLVGWEFQASPRAQIRPISFLVFRRLHASSAIFTLITQHQFWYMKERSRTVTVHLDESEYAVVNSHDMIGWHVPSGDVIDYKTTNVEPSIYMISGNKSNLKVGINYTFNGKQEHGRLYGIKALLKAVPPPNLMSLSRRITLKCPLEADDYITTIEASKGGFVRYNMDGHNPWFSVDELTGDVKTIIPISGNLSCDIHVLATATCDVQTTIVLNFQCIALPDQMDNQMSNVNGPPVAAAPELISVSEDIPGETSLFTVSATDWNTGVRPNISIVCINQSTSHHFVMQSGTVKPKENASLGNEETSASTFQIQAEDGHTMSAASFVTLQITDVNEPPVTHQTRLFIQAQTAKAGHCVSSTDLREIFSDPDNDTLTFSILKENDTDWFPFMIDTFTGFLCLSHDVNVTRKTAPLVLSAWIVARDPGKLSAQTEVEVAFTFVNTKPVLPELPVHITLMERTFTGDVVYTVSARDEDEDSVTLRYHSLVEMTNTVVSVNISSGEIKLLTCPPLSQGQYAFMSLIITAFDGEDTSDPGVLNITIVGVNEPPKFPKEEYRIIINETQVGQYIASQETWLVDDPDPDDKLTFFIMGGGASEDIVYVNSITGEMAIKEFYDIDLDGCNSSLVVLLMVIDTHGLNASTKVILNITDVNDNIPIVENDGEIFFIPRNITPGWRVGQVKATDSDSGKNGELKYSITGISLNATSYLINSRDGWILFSGILPSEDRVTIYFSVSDKGQPSNTVTAVVHVFVASSPSSNETVVPSNLLQHSNSAGVDNSNNPAVLILTGLVICSVLVITALSYQLWKMKKVLRMTEPEQGHDAHHDYRFQWVPRQIVEEGPDADLHNPGSPLSTFPSFLKTSVSNQNFHYEPAVLAQSQELQEPSQENQAAEGSKCD